jgi:mitochondrial translocator assembly and maintenance protein 41
VVAAGPVRRLATESVPSSMPGDAPFPHPAKHPPQPHPQSQSQPKPRSAMLPQPRRSVRARQPSLPRLPPEFGKNQLLPVSNSTRALLESIVAHFDAPIRYAFAYGSGVFEQDGYNKQTADGSAGPMLDFMFAVSHADHFHSINIHQNPQHYTLHARLLGSDYISRVQKLGPGVWFNTLVPIEGVVRAYFSSLPVPL